MDPLPLRLAEPEDAENIARLVNAAYRVERFFSNDDRTNMEGVRAHLQEGKFLLVEESGVLLACVYVEVQGERGYFGLLSVDPEHQGAGLGSRLAEAAEDYCRAAGCRFMDITIVNLRKKLPAFYGRLGYVESGTEPYPADLHPIVPCHLIQMSKPLS
jgi:GNAT superfamily N-acetyltransferase